MLGLMGFSGSLPLYVIHRYYIFVFIDRANKDACLLACKHIAKKFNSLSGMHEHDKQTDRQTDRQQTDGS